MSYSKLDMLAICVCIYVLLYICISGGGFHGVHVRDEDMGPAHLLPLRARKTICRDQGCF